MGHSLVSAQKAGPVVFAKLQFIRPNYEFQHFQVSSHFVVFSVFIEICFKQIVTTFGTGQSYIELQTMRHVEHKTSIYIEFKTLRQDGQILYIEQEGFESGRDFLSIALVNGFVEFRYNLGSGAAVLRSLKKVIMGMWHSVSVKVTQ